jgi:hypothetical protein
MNVFAGGLSAAIEAKAEVFADAVVREMELEDTRHHVKIAAIERIMKSGDNPMTGKPHSFSSAEALVNTDAEYAAHLEKQRDAARARILARGAYDAAIAAAKVCETV